MYAQLAAGVIVAAAAIVALILFVAAPTPALENVGLVGVIYTTAAAVVLYMDWRQARVEQLTARAVHVESSILNELHDRVPLN